MNFKSLLVIIAALFLVGVNGVSQKAAAEKSDKMQIVTVNIQDVLLSSDAGQGVRKKLETKVLELQEKLQKDQEEIQTMQAEIEKKSSVWSEQVREEKEGNYQKKVREMQLKQEDAQFEIQQIEKQEMEPILKELQMVIADLGKKNGYAMIMDSRAGLLYADENLDISEIVRKELDAKLAASNTKKDQ
jgi:outer membrane protein